MSSGKEVTIPIEEYSQLLEESRWLGCLEAAGAQRWVGYDKAQEMYDELYPEED